MRTTLSKRSFIPHSILALLGFLFLICVAFGSGGQEVSWAAPAQNPHLQTIPTRPPEPPPPPSNPSSRKDDDHEDTADIPPLQPPASPLPAQPSEGVEAGEDKGEIPFTQLPGANEEAEDNPPLVQPHESEEPASPSSVEPQTPPTGQAGSPASLPTAQPTPNLPALPPTSELPTAQIGSLIWLYALGLGAILILSGIYLVKRA